MSSQLVDYWYLVAGQLQPGKGAGLLLGIVGTLLCLLSVVLYSPRKRLAPFQHIGAKRHWLSLHILLGTIGPLLIAGHARHHLLGIKGLVNLAMWGVVVSGLLARYLATSLTVAKTRRLQLLKELTTRYHWESGETLYFLRPAQRRRLLESMRTSPLDQSPGLWRLVQCFFLDLQLLWDLQQAARMVRRGEKLPGDRRRGDRRNTDRRAGERRRAERQGDERRSEDRRYGGREQSAKGAKPGGIRRSKSLPEAFRKTLVLQRNLLLLGIHEASAPFWISIHTGLSIGFLLFLNLHIVVAILFSPQMTVWPFLPPPP